MKIILTPLQKIAKKYETVNHNADNYSIGGGLSDGAFASNRHEDAKYDGGKLTEGKATALFKKATALEIDLVKSIINFAIPNMEWHHAGKLPKQYGGGMKKTYFLNAKEIVDLAKNWDNYQLKYLNHIETKRLNDLSEGIKNKQRQAFLEKNATYVLRTGTHKELFVCTNTECEGKFGWFCASKNKYNLPEYYSGWLFKSIEKFNEFKNI